MIYICRNTLVSGTSSFGLFLPLSTPSQSVTLPDLTSRQPGDLTPTHWPQYHLDIAVKGRREVKQNDVNEYIDTPYVPALHHPFLSTSRTYQAATVKTLLRQFRIEKMNLPVGLLKFLSVQVPPPIPSLLNRWSADHIHLLLPIRSSGFIEVQVGGSPSLPLLLPGRSVVVRRRATRGLHLLLPIRSSGFVEVQPRGSFGGPDALIDAHSIGRSSSKSNRVVHALTSPNSLPPALRKGKHR